MKALLVVVAALALWKLKVLISLLFLSKNLVIQGQSAGVGSAEAEEKLAAERLAPGPHLTQESVRGALAAR